MEAMQSPFGNDISKSNVPDEITASTEVGSKHQHLTNENLEKQLAY